MRAIFTPPENIFENYRIRKQLQNKIHFSQSDSEYSLYQKGDCSYTARIMKLKNLFREKNIHLIFEFSLVGKSIIAFSEIVAGITTYFVTQNFLIRLITSITKHELATDSRDVIANYLMHAVQNFSISTQHFTAFYLLSHGIIKMVLVI